MFVSIVSIECMYPKNKGMGGFRESAFLIDDRQEKITKKPVKMEELNPGGVKIDSSGQQTF